MSSTRREQRSWAGARTPSEQTWDHFALRTHDSQASIAWRIASRVHGKERDRRRVPYLLHPIGVTSFGLQDWFTPSIDPATGEQGRSHIEQAMGLLDVNVDEFTAALLAHDVVEHLYAQYRREESWQVPMLQRVGMVPQGAYAMLESKGLTPKTIQLIDGLTYIPPAENLSYGQKLIGQANKLLRVPGAKLLKPYDLAHNQLPGRLYPYLSAKDTVHAVWKYTLLCRLVDIKPYGMENGFSDLSLEVRDIPGMSHMMENLSPDDPPRNNLTWMEALERLPTQNWTEPGLAEGFGIGLDLIA